MKTVGKVIAWVCIFSTTFIGCYSSTLIDPSGSGRKKIYSGDIQYVIMKDGIKHVFPNPPTVIDEAIVGEVLVNATHTRTVTKHASIPISEVAEVSVSEFSDSRAIIVTTLSLGIIVSVILIDMASQ